MKRKLNKMMISLATAMLMMACAVLPVWAAPDPCSVFRDVDRNAWYHEGLDYVVESGVMSGTGKTTFEPSGVVSRAMTLQTFYAIAGKPGFAGTTAFSDVKSAAWYYSAVNWGARNELAAGYMDGTFRPNANVTREQLAVFFKAFAKYQKRDVSGKKDIRKYTDYSSISSYARDAMSWAVDAGLITGRTMTTLAPKGTATRAELAQILYRYLQQGSGAAQDDPGEITPVIPTPDTNHDPQPSEEPSENPNPADTPLGNQEPGEAPDTGNDSAPAETKEPENDSFLDVTEAYNLLNEFRAEKDVWYWNPDNTTKTVFNSGNGSTLSPLARNSALEETAKVRAKELVQQFSHTRPNGTICFTAYPSGMMAAGENIAAGHPSIQVVTEAWKETSMKYDGQGHRRNMLSSEFNAVGIAGYYHNGVIYWVQCFGYI